jgi:Inner membrane component of T3SS, cytoplasmic domain
MHLELHSHGQSLPLDWPPGTYVVGGGRMDALCVDGLPPALVRVTVAPDRLLVVAGGRVWLRGVRLPPGRTCWLLPGESLRLERRGRVRLALADPAPQLGTRSLLRRLLASMRVPTEVAVPRLLCVSGPDLGRTLLLRPGRQELGRGPGCALRVADGAVSRRHLSLTMDAHRVVVEDLGTPGGTRVNGWRAPGKGVLLSGDLVGVGRTLLAFAVPPAAPQARTRQRGARGGRRLVAAFLLGSLLAGAALAALYGPGGPGRQERSGASPARSTSSSTSRR